MKNLAERIAKAIIEGNSISIVSFYVGEVIRVSCDGQLDVIENTTLTLW